MNHTNNHTHLYALNTNKQLVFSAASFLHDHFVCVCGCQTQLIPIPDQNAFPGFEYKNPLQPCPNPPSYRNARLCEHAFTKHWPCIFYKINQCSNCNVPSIQHFLNVADVSLPHISSPQHTEHSMAIELAMRHLHGTWSKIKILAPDYYGVTTARDTSTEDNLTPVICIHMKDILNKMPQILAKQEVTLENLNMTKLKCMQCQVHERKRKNDQAVHTLQLKAQDKLTFDMAYALVPNDPKAFLYLRDCAGPSAVRRALDYLPPPQKKTPAQVNYTKADWQALVLSEIQQETQRVQKNAARQ